MSDIVYQDKPHTIWYHPDIDKYSLTSPTPYEVLWSTTTKLLLIEIDKRKKKDSKPEQLKLWEV